MAEAVINGARPINVDQTNEPNNFIIWLDKHIGKPEECVLLKRSLFMTMDPTTRLYERNLNKDDLDKSICFESALFVQLDQVEFKFQAFVDVEKCYETIKNNLEKRIFFITSGSKGQIIVPSLVANFEGAFGKNNRIYIFCSNMLMQEVEGVDPPSNTWALNFLEYILMFNHQDDLLARMVSNIADYFFTEAKRFDDNQHLDNACKHYDWAKRMYQRYETIESTRKTSEIRDIDQRLNDIERRRNPYMTDENDIVGETCS
jgi:hypothetical protein